MRTPTITATALLSMLTVGVLQAQDPAGPKATFLLSAGEHRIDAFCELTAQIRKGTVTIDEEQLADALADTLTIQRDLRLTASEWEDVATSILFTRGLLMVPDGQPDRYRLVFERNAVDEDSIERTVEELLARPRRIELVAATVSTGNKNPKLLVNGLRPFLITKRSTISMTAADKAVLLKGPTTSVAYATRLIGALQGQPAPVEPRVAIEGQDARAWPGGEIDASAFVSLLSRTLDANIIGAAPSIDLQLGDATELEPVAWYERASRTLFEAGFALVPLVPEQRVFLLAPTDDASRNWLALSRFETADTIARAEDAVTVTTVMKVDRADCQRVVNGLRKFLGGRDRSVYGVGSFGDGRLIIVGVRGGVTRAMRTVQQLLEGK